MSRDLRRLYAELGDVDPGALPPPDVLRGRADQRARRLVVAGCVAIAFLVGGTAVAVNATYVRTDAPPPPGTSPTVTVSPTPPNTSPSPAATTAAPPTGPIPNSAFFTQPKEREAWPPYPFHDTTDLGLPPLCGATFPAAVSRGRTHEIFYNDEDHPEFGPLGTVDQSILVHRPGGAAATMQRLRTAVAACPHENLDGGASRDSTTLSTTGFGDEYVLLESRWSGIQQPYNVRITRISYWSVVRIGEVITVLMVSGWEDISADRGVTDKYTGLAVTALRGWLT